MECTHIFDHWNWRCKLCSKSLGIQDYIDIIRAGTVKPCITMQVMVPKVSILRWIWRIIWR